MDDCDNKTNIKKIKRKRKQIDALQRFGSNVSTILQSIWVRCRTIFPTSTDRKFMESELRFVLYSGILFWTLYLVYEAIK